jgi:hypothetical protein
LSKDSECILLSRFCFDVDIGTTAKELKGTAAGSNPTREPGFQGINAAHGKAP